MCMKFTCTRENLSHALDTVSAVAGKQTNLPILDNILLSVSGSKVDFAATNLELAVRTTVRAKVENEGTFTVPAKTLGDYVRLLSGEQVELELKGSELEVRCGSASTKIKGAPADDFPVLPDVGEGDEYTLLASPLKESLSRVGLAAAKNEIRPELSGVYMGLFTDRYKGAVFAATDSYRLSEHRMSVAQGDKERRAIVPARTVFELTRLLSLGSQDGAETQVRVTISDTQIAVRYGSFELISRLIDGTYPDYVQIVPENFRTTATFPSDVMARAIKAASIFTTTGVNAVSFDFNSAANTVGVSSTSTQKGEHSSTVEAEVEGEENSILLNHRYLLDGLQHMGGEVEFAMNSGDAPCMLREKGKEESLYIVMPIRQ